MDNNDVLVTVLAKVPAGTWGRTADGRVKFVKDPNFEFPDTDDDKPNDDPSDPLGLRNQQIKQVRNNGTGETHLSFDL